MKIVNVMLGFVLVFLSSALWPNLPKTSLIALLFFILLLWVALSRNGIKHPRIKFVSAIIIGMISGFLWASISGYYYLYWQIPDEYFYTNVLVEGEVESLMPLTDDPQYLNQQYNAHQRILSPEKEERNIRKIDSHLEQAKHYRYLSSKKSSQRSSQKSSQKFTLSVSKIGHKTLLNQPKVRLSWYRPTFSLKQGQTLTLLVSLKRPVGLANPDGFNYQKWLVSKNIVALGYIRDSPSNKALSSKVSMRQTLVDELQSISVTHLKWILALSYGDRHLLNDDDWAFLQRTGTAHLFAISGMHLAIVFGFMVMLFKTSLFAYLHVGVSADKQYHFNYFAFAMVVALSIACGYAYLAGFDIPVMRALITLSVWIALIVLKLHWQISSVLLTLLCSFFILFPYSILGLSFWFSFGAVFAILFFTWRFPIKKHATFRDKCYYAIKLQLFLSVATLPMIAGVFDSLPLIGFIANLIMIPIVTFLLVPLCLLASLLHILFGPISALYALIDSIFTLSFYMLHQIDTFASKHISDNTTSSMLTYIRQPFLFILLAVILLPAWQNKRRSLIVCTTIFFIFSFNQSKQIDKAQWSLYAMDVGQGTALIIEKEQPAQQSNLKNSALSTEQDYQYMLYDTGNSGENFSMAASVLKPFFEARNVTHLSLFILSHLDKDHAGGALVIRKLLEIDNELTPAHGCNVFSQQQNYSGQQPIKFIEGLDINILWPLEPLSGHENNHSCVVKISSHNGKNSVLLTGDIEKSVEEKLVHLYADSDALKATVLIAPHHGSKSSSSLAFLQAVNPQHVVFTAGYKNRWGFVHSEVLARYQQLGINTLNTGIDGRIKLTFNENDPYINKYRQDEYKRWFFTAPM